MATRRLAQDEMSFLVTNIYNKAIVVASIRVDPGEVKTIPAHFIIGNFSRWREIVSFVVQRKIEVQVRFMVGGLGTVPVSSFSQISLQPLAEDPAVGGPSS